MTGMDGKKLVLVTLILQIIVSVTEISVDQSDG